ncbi:MAG: 16S rRNA (cytosine967-C5)-methyltransferase [Lentisphaeria bacterium]|jgi:16S rRNA (cytosine967-C5)-methyltransferase
MNVRAQAAKTLAPVLQQKASLNSVYEQYAEPLPTRDRAIFKEICFGVVRHYFTLSGLSNKLLGKPLKNKDADIHALILIGLYQLKYMRTPDHAAISETVSGAKALKKLWANKLINGVLRTYTRDKQTLEASLSGNISAQYDHPEWLITKVKKAWPDNWKNILLAANQQGPLTLRVNQHLTTRTQFCEKLIGEGGAQIEVRPCEFSADGLVVDGASDITSLPGFNEGLFSVQDEAAQLSAGLLDLAANQRVLDACCAPGGKTCHIAESEAQLEELVAIELDALRMQRVRENLKRLQLSASLIIDDAANTASWWNGMPFDRILLDAPCSATGVIRRHPDIKVLRRESDLIALQQLQMTLLQTLWSALAPGGVIVYATCSILPEENEAVVGKFVNSQEDAIHLPIESNWGLTRPYGKQLFPQIDGHDGFYYARLKKALA